MMVDYKEASMLFFIIVCVISLVIILIRGV